MPTLYLQTYAEERRRMPSAALPCLWIVGGGDQISKCRASLQRPTGTLERLRFYANPEDSAVKSFGYFGHDREATGYLGLLVELLGECDRSSRSRRKTGECL